MPISVTCQCGARLEIDEKFLGKAIPCPDCQRPLPTNAPPPPPPLDLPDYRHTSGLAVLSLALALVGAFTIVGTIAAIVVGVFALKQIADKSSKLDGIHFARAGIAIGALFTLITLAAFFSPTVFGIDSVLRELAFAGRLQHQNNDLFESNNAHRENIVLKRQTNNWAGYLSLNPLTNNLQTDDLIMVNVQEDAYIACQTLLFDGGVEADDEKEKKALERFYKSELVNLIGRLNGRPLDREGVIVEKKLIEGGAKQEIIIDLRLGGSLWGSERRFLIQYPTKDRDKLTILVAGTRKNRFERMQDEFRKTFDSQKMK